MRRAVLWGGAGLSMAAALFLLLLTGLPERAQFTGVISAGGMVTAPEMNAIAPLFSGDLLDGGRVDLLDLRGQPVIINFWATWCVPCAVEMPELEHVYRQYETEGLRILAVNLGESQDAMREWRQTFVLTFDMIADMDHTIAEMYQLRGQPSTYVISPQGIITQVFFGPTSEIALTNALAPFFSDTSN